MTRKLSLSKETLTELTDPQLAYVLGGAMKSGTTCPVAACVNSDYNCLILWPTKRGCTPAVPE